MHIDLEPAYLLHTRPYRNTSLLVDVLTPDHGRISAVVKGVRSSGKAAKQKRSLMQPLVPLLIGWTGRGDLKTITGVEARGPNYVLVGKHLFSAMYANELLTRLLQSLEPHPEIFSLYEWLLKALANTQENAETARCDTTPL